MYRNKPVHIYSFTRVLFYFLPLLFLFEGCTKDSVPAHGPETEEAMVRLTIKTPGNTVPKSATRSAVDAEYLVTDVKVMVFDLVGNDYQYRYMVDGQQISQDGNSLNTSFYALLKSSDDPVKLLIVANSSAAFASFTPVARENEDNVRKKLTQAFDPDGLGALPMYGEVSLDRLKTDVVNTINVRMLRSLARVDVVNDLDMDRSRPFELEEVFIYRAMDGLQTLPDRASLAEVVNPRVNSPSVPAEAGRTGRYSKRVDLTTTTITKLYVPESLRNDNESEQLLGVTCVVVGGYYNGESNPSYYRIDFNSGQSGHPYGQVLRNYKYEFKIKSVTSRGWETPDDAANNRATLMIAEIQQWEDFTTEMHSNGDNYLGVSGREMLLTYKKDSKKILSVQASVPYTMAWLDANGDPIETTGEEGRVLTGQHFTAEMYSLPGENEDRSHIRFVSRAENFTTAERIEYLLIKYGGWEFTIKVVQEYYQKHRDRTVRVLTSVDAQTGHLGSSGNPATADGERMRRILSNSANFSKTGTVKFFAGFDFSLFGPSRTIFNSTSSGDNAHYLRNMLMGADVLHLGNDNQLSYEAAVIILEWLEADPHRVLICGADSGPTSGGLLRADMGGPLQNDLDWWYNNSYGCEKVGGSGYHNYQAIGYSNHFVTPGVNSNNGFILDGPFGKIPANTRLTCADYYFGYAKTYKSTIVPVLVHGTYPSYMIVGVDPERRIVYMGDHSMFQAGGMSSSALSSGTISNDQDRFWANVWAYVAEIVIWGGDER